MSFTSSCTLPCEYHVKLGEVCSIRKLILQCNAVISAVLIDVEVHPCTDIP
uniref:Uncharacterized protein n=1 Tax=Rhizophora mucronata TaxID=61149 RepID=A0A2P2N093_RHIMU